MSSEIANLSNLLVQLRGLVQSARRQALRAVDTLQVRTCWEIGRHTVEFEQQGTDRAAYGARLTPTLAESLTVEFGRGFDASNLRYMGLFYQAFPIHDALRHELSWTHYRNLLLLNPLTPAIGQMRGVLFWCKLPDMTVLSVSLLVAALVAWLGFAWFQKTRKGFADVL